MLYGTFDDISSFWKSTLLCSGDNLLSTRFKIIGFTVYDLSRPKGAASFGDDMASQKVGVLYTPESKYKAHKFESDDENAVKKIMAIKEAVPAAPAAAAPKQTSDVAGLTKMIQSNTSLMNRLKTVNNGQEVTETIAFILNNINPKASGVNKSKLKSIIDQRFK